MKDWYTVQPDVVKLMNKHFTKGRTRKLRYITLHHMAGVGDVAQCWQWWQTRAASAHYAVAPDGEVGQLVWDRDTAWSNGDSVSNAESITIEHSNLAGAGEDWPISSKTLEEGAHLVAALCRFYELGRPQYGVNVRTHDEFYGTSCPYHLRPGHKYHDEYIARAGEWYDDMTQNPHPKETDTMALNDTEQQQLNRIEDQQVEILKQLGQPGGWPQGGDRTLYDLTAAVAEVEGVPNTRDTLA